MNFNKFNPVTACEAEMEKWLGSPHVRAVCNGTSAIKAALLAVGVKPGQTVITTPYTFVATGNAIHQIGAKPMFVDTKPDLTIDPERIRGALAITENVGAILPVHIFGRSCDIDALAEIKIDYNIPIVEDACQAIGALVSPPSYRGKQSKYLGTFFDAGAMSGYASKNLWAGYEAGWVLTNNPLIADRVELLRNHGLENGEMVMMGYNWKFNQLSAFNVWTQLKLHKKGILAELGKLGPEDGYYSKLVFEHQWYKENPDAWFEMGCPVALAAAKEVREMKK